MATSADYIIVGGGSAGCVLANRLSADPAVKVVLLEVGPADKNLLYRMPAGFFPLMQAGKGNWNFETVPQTAMGDRRLYFPRGKVLGGSSAINGMVVSRGNAGDYDRWAAKGNAGWSWQEVLPYFKKLEADPAGDPAVRGRSGPIGVSRVPLESMNPTSKAWLEGGQQAGHPFNPDMNAGDPLGMAQMQGNYADGIRHSASARYLDPVRPRPNLQIITEALASKVMIEQGRATGVEYLHKGKRREIHAQREVLLAGGVVNSPQLLMLSGIGDADELAAHGITLRQALPGVGKNLQDHLAVAVKQRITQPHSMLKDLKWYRMAWTGLQYLVGKSGPAAVSALEAWAHLKTRPDLDYPDLQIYSVPLMHNDHGRDIIQEEGCMAVMNGSRPRSSGTVKLASANPAEAPLIDPQYLTDPDDLRVLRDGIRMVREIFAQAAYDDFRGDEYAPGAAVQSDAELDTYIRENANTLYHPVGTCKMGVDEMAVVDPQLKVRGIDGLRVVDASIMPDVVSGNTNFPAMMIGEKAADMILQSAGNR
ncbi:choline dehydrogenase-like flavoprotein [Spongiibacter sp. IMCC21906]|uniref:GMC family oxidoreductase n=1 Tax=Spongiibacter sp. IMCC21906 TaxID=1620392 RepID=UPI00062E087F|nr:choline dehydrogenase [Spongiibacter sp. IMCC21906]AKH68656.1 choline dehydrogenase-like flavoprotein [Spongiibacter sp. IMCC21906]